MIGSVLYNVGGFVLPFALVGSCSLLLTLCLTFTVPSMSGYKQIDEEKIKIEHLINVLLKHVNTVANLGVQHKWMKMDFIKRVIGDIAVKNVYLRLQKNHLL